MLFTLHVRGRGLIGWTLIRLLPSALSHPSSNMICSSPDYVLLFSLRHTTEGLSFAAATNYNPEEELNKSAQFSDAHDEALPEDHEGRHAHRNVQVGHEVDHVDRFGQQLCDQRVQKEVPKIFTIVIICKFDLYLELNKSLIKSKKFIKGSFKKICRLVKYKIDS